MPEGLCLVYASDTSDAPGPGCAEAGACYSNRLVWFLFGSEAIGDLGSLAHEACHAHQHQAVLAIGLSGLTSDS